MCGPGRRGALVGAARGGSGWRPGQPGGRPLFCAASCPPTAPPGGVLVRTTHSVISVGTEKMKVEQARMNLLQKARARPDQVRKVLETARNLGWRSALEKVRNRLVDAANEMLPIFAQHVLWRPKAREMIGHLMEARDRERLRTELNHGVRLANSLGLDVSDVRLAPG